MTDANKIVQLFPNRSDIGWSDSDKDSEANVKYGDLLKAIAEGENKIPASLGKVRFFLDWRPQNVEEFQGFESDLASLGLSSSIEGVIGRPHFAGPVCALIVAGDLFAPQHLEMLSSQQIFVDFFRKWRVCLVQAGDFKFEPQLPILDVDRAPS